MKDKKKLTQAINALNRIMEIDRASQQSSSGELHYPVADLSLSSAR